MKKLLCLLALLVGFTTFLFAQAPSAVLEYYEDNSGEFKAVTADGEELYAADLDFGCTIPVGCTLVTDAGDYAEISLQPSGSVIRLSQNTNFKIEALQGVGGAPKNAFSMAVGKFRAVAAKGKGSQRYDFKGASAVCGVRGTDLGMEVLPGEKELAFVLDGVIDYTNSAGQSISIGAGQMADAMAAAFEAVQIPAELMSELLEGMEFQRVKLPTAEAPPAEGEGEAPAEPEAKAEEGLVADVLQFLGVEIGSVTLDTPDGPTTFAKAIVQPRFSLGKLKVALYLPIIYQSNLFDPSDWYHPQGNDEWSFGTDKQGWDRIALDAAQDLLLKIRYIEYAEQRDPFFFKIGNIAGVDLGHGLIMRGYRNDTDFPAVRRVGLNLGVDREKGGFELLVNDLTELPVPEIVAARLYTRPAGKAFPLALGLSAVADFWPGAVYERFPDATYSDYGRPIFLNAGLDLDLPIIDRDPLSIVLFSDVAAMLPWFREAVPAAGIEEAGPAWDAVWDSGASRPRNWGLAAGLLGNILILDYRLEYRYTAGTFRTAFYNDFYERQRGVLVDEVVRYLADSDNPVYDVTRMGIYGEAGFTIAKFLGLQIGYEWPWYAGGTGDGEMPDDYFKLKLALLKGLPVVKIKGSLSYERIRMMPTLLGEGGLSLFDENTVLTGELEYPISPLLNMAVLVTTTGVEDPATGRMEPFTSVSFVTRVNY